MPWLICHNYIAASALENFNPGTGNNYRTAMQAIIASHRHLMVRARENTWGALTNVNEQACNAAGMLYLGGNGPDWFYYPVDDDQIPPDIRTALADLGHWNRTSTYPIWALMNLKRRINTSLLTPLEVNELAFWLGYISHIAGDVGVHPYIASIVGAYHHLRDIFAPLRVTAGTRFVVNVFSTIGVFKFHAIVEHFHEAYCVFDRFRQPPFNIEHSDSLNFQRAGIHALPNTAGFSPTRSAVDFYNRGGQFTQEFVNRLDQWITGYFLNSNFMQNFDNYLDDVVPNADTELANRALFVRPNILNRYITRAVELNRIWWTEALNYLSGPHLCPNTTDPIVIAKELYKAKKYFPTFKRHWNLDSGFGWDVTTMPGDNAQTFSPKDKNDNEFLKKMIIMFGLNLENGVNTQI